MPTNSAIITATFNDDIIIDSGINTVNCHIKDGLNLLSVSFFFRLITVIYLLSNITFNGFVILSLNLLFRNLWIVWIT